MLFQLISYVINNMVTFNSNVDVKDGEPANAGCVIINYADGSETRNCIMSKGT